MSLQHLRRTQFTSEASLLQSAAAAFSAVSFASLIPAGHDNHKSSLADSSRSGAHAHTQFVTCCILAESAPPQKRKCGVSRVSLPCVRKIFLSSTFRSSTMLRFAFVEPPMLCSKQNPCLILLGTTSSRAHESDAPEKRRSAACG